MPKLAVLLLGALYLYAHAFCSSLYYLSIRHHPVGRLDADSSGLLLLSSDGGLTHRLLNPRCFCSFFFVCISASLLASSWRISTLC